MRAAEGACNRKVRLVPAADLAVFCSEMAMLLRAGISLSDGIGIIAGHAAPEGAAMLQGMKERLDDSQPLSSAMEQAGCFPSQLTGMVELGESAGTLDRVMEAMSAHYRREDELHRQIRSAFAYPAAVLIIMTAVMGVLSAKVFPVFSGVFEVVGGEMSAAAAAAASMGRVFTWIAGAAALLLLLCGGLIRAAGLTEKGKALLNRLAVRLPLIRRFSRKVSSARFCDSFSMLLAGGYNAEDALEQVAAILPDPVVQQAVAVCREKLQAGQELGGALVETGLFDGLQSGLIAVAAQSGTLDSTLKTLADESLDQLDEMTGRAVSLIEPVMIGLTAVMIGSVLLSVMLPLAGMLSAIG